MLVRPEPEGTDPLLAAAPIYRSCGLYSVRSTRTESGVAEYIWIGYNVCVATHSSQPCKVLGPLTTAFIMPRGNRASWVSDIPVVTPHSAFEVAVGNTHQKASTPGNRRASSTKPSLGTPRPRRNMSHVGLGCPTLVNVHAMALASCLMNERNRDSLSERSKPGVGRCNSRNIRGHFVGDRRCQTCLVMLYAFRSQKRARRSRCIGGGLQNAILWNG